MRDHNKTRDVVPRSWWNFSPNQQGLIAVSLLFLISILLLTKIFTSDYGTHLALGRQIVQTRSIPDREFLNYPSLGIYNPNGAWGFQVVLYLVYSIGGNYSVSFLCWGLVYLILVLLYRSMLLRGANPLLAVLALFAFSGFFRIRIQPRPELFTYLFISLTIFLLTKYFFGNEKEKKVIYLFPPIILVWANMHPSYLVAFVLLGVFFFDSVARSLWNRQWKWASAKKWVIPPMIVGGAGLLLCGVNPHGYDALLTPLRVISKGTMGDGGDGSRYILSWISELTPVKATGMYKYYLAAATFASISMMLGLFGRKIYLLDVLLFSLAFKGAWDSSRAVSMIGLFIAPGTSLHLTGFFKELKAKLSSITSVVVKNSKKPPVKRKKKRALDTDTQPRQNSALKPRYSYAYRGICSFMVIALLVFGGYSLAFSISQLEYGVGLTEHKFSLKASEFLKKNPIKGNMFNFFDIGGFLDWQLYPNALTFIDGRTYNQQVFMEHQRVTSTMGDWKEIVRKYGVTYFVLKTVDSSGMILPITIKLWNDPDWSLVFADGLFVVFVRNSPENREYIKTHQIPKSYLTRHILWESYHYMYLGVSPVVVYQTMSRMYEIMGNRQEAINHLRKAMEAAKTPLPFQIRLEQLLGQQRR